jgi:hypothetical protein
MSERVYSKELKELFKNGDPERIKILEKILEFSSNNPQIEHLEFTVVPKDTDNSVLQIDLKLFDS